MPRADQTADAAEAIIVFSNCETCRGGITTGSGQNGQWSHIKHPARGKEHPAVPEIRFCVDETCPACGHPEIGYSPDAGLFMCSRCLWRSPERPAS